MKLDIFGNVCLNYNEIPLSNPTFNNSLLIEVGYFAKSPSYSSNILRFGEESEILTKMHPEPNDTNFLSVQSPKFLSQTTREKQIQAPVHLF